MESPGGSTITLTHDTMFVYILQKSSWITTYILHSESILTNSFCYSMLLNIPLNLNVQETNLNKLPIQSGQSVHLDKNLQRSYKIINK